MDSGDRAKSVPILQILLISVGQFRVADDIDISIVINALLVPLYEGCIVIDVLPEGRGVKKLQPGATMLLGKTMPLRPEGESPTIQKMRVNDPHIYPRKRFRNSALAIGLSRNTPVREDVTIIEFCLRTPRHTMQRWEASTTQADPFG